MKSRPNFRSRSGEANQRRIVTRRSPRWKAFTLVELLVVIAVIGVLAALIFPAFKNARQLQLNNRARAELNQVATCIESYKAKFGHYPPDNRNPVTHVLAEGLNPLYYELAGTAVSSDGIFTPKDGLGSAMTPAMIATFFGPGVEGFVNTDRGGGDEGTRAAQLVGTLKHDQIAATTVTNESTGMSARGNILVCTVPGPDSNVPALNNGRPPLNPWRYNSSSPTNNTASYDLWTDIYAGRKVLRICNWSSKPVPIP